MAQQRGGIKLRRGTKHKGMYAAQRIRTARNKQARLTKRSVRKAMWKAKGVKKNGQFVKGASEEQRANAMLARSGN